MDLAWELKSQKEYEDDGYTICTWGILNGLQRLGKRTGRIRNQRTIHDHSDYSTVQIGIIVQSVGTVEYTDCTSAEG